MNTNDLNTALYEKMAAEQDKYRDWLKSQSPEEILNHTYEYTIREDIVMAMEELELTDAQAQALLESPSPLADVYRYFEKLETGYMDVIRDSIENRADDVCRAKEELRTTPVYPHSAAYAREHGELEQYRASNNVNRQCKESIEAAVREHFDGMYLSHDAAKGVIETYGMERVSMVLSNTVQLQDWDGRYSRRNKEWAKTIPNDNPETVRCGYALNSHPAVLDGFMIWCVKNSSAAVPREKNWNRPVPQYGISSNRSCPPISLPPRKNGSWSDNHGKAQAGCAGFVLGVRRRTGTDPSKDAAIRDREFERLFAENGAGWLCGQAGTAGAEGVGLPDAPKQQQLESADL
mgnify:FL=1